MNGPTNLFAYGTLVPGGPAWPLLARWVDGTPVADAVRGRLYDTGRGYPAATFATGETGLVHGVVATLSPASATAALAALDEYEASEYVRAEVVTEGGVPAIAYHWAAPLEGCAPVPGGRWPVN